MATDGTTTLALTSVFTPPSSCSSSWTYENSYYNSVSGGLLIQHALLGRLDQECFPSGMKAYGRAMANQVYSPGACPIGYATPAMYKGGDVTTAICCPAGFIYSTTLTTINFVQITSVMFAGCISGYPFGSSTTVRARASNTALTDAIITGPVTMWAQPLTMLYQSTDLRLFTTANSTQIVPPTSLVASSSQVIQSPPAQSKSNSSVNTSPGMIVGIVFGSIAALLLVAVIGFLILCLRRHRARGSLNEGSTNTPGFPVNKSTSAWMSQESGNLITKHQAPVEMSAGRSSKIRETSMHELPA